MVSNATCAVCHAPLPAEALVCPNCGTPVAQGDPPAPATEKARSDLPTAWATFAPPASPYPGTNGSAPVADTAPTEAIAPGAESAAPLNSTAPLPIRPAGTLTSGRIDNDPAPPVDMPVSTLMPAPSARNVESPAATTWLAGEPSPPPLAPPPAPAPAPVATTAPILTVPPPAPLVTAPAAPAPAAPPTGALVLLRGEEVVIQLGALYLTNKRAILYAPTILRAAFLRDIDAIGTITERSSGWMLLFGLLGLALAAVSAYIGISQPSAEFKLGELYSASPVLLAIPLALIGILALASYFFWIKRSLFLSVGGRPLIVVSISGWSGKKLTAVDSFVNAFSQAKESDQSQV
jgi:hypothetical protein